MPNKAILGQITGFKAVDDDDQWEMTFDGRPSTEDVDSYREVTSADGFMKAMKPFMAKNPVMMFNHNPGATIGKILEYDRDKIGPLVTAAIAKTALGREVAELIRAGVISKMSFIFTNPKYEDDEDNGIRYLKEFEILEVGPVSIPANMGATIMSAKSRHIEVPELERLVNEAAGTKGRNMPDPHVKTEHTKRLDEIDRLVGDTKDQVAELAMSHSEFEKARDEQAKLMKTLEGQVGKLHEGRITEGDFTTLSEKIGGDIEDLQKQIKRFKQANKVAGERESQISWKARDPKATPQIFDDTGRPAPEQDQRAHHLFHAPVEYEGEYGRRLKQLRDLHDCVLFADAYLRNQSRSPYNITNLKTFKLLHELAGDFDPEFAKAMASTSTALGDEWVPTEASALLYDAYRLANNLVNYIPSWDMPGNPSTWPIRTSHPRLYRASERTTNAGTVLRKSDMGTGAPTFTAETFAVAVVVSPQFIEDSIIQVVPALRESIGIAMADGEESRIINGHANSTHMDTAADWATDTSYPEQYENGLRYLANNSTVTQTINVQSASTGIGDATSAFVADDVRYLRYLMPAKWGHQADKLVYATTLKVWLKMLSFVQYSQIGTYGANASWLTGGMPQFDGSDIVLTGQLSDDLESTGLQTGSSTLKGLLCLAFEGFKIGRRGGVIIEFEKNIQTQQFAFVGSYRSSFKAMTSAGVEPVTYAINIV